MPPARHVFNTLSPLPFLLFFASLCSATRHLAPFWSFLTSLLCALSVCSASSSLRTNLRTLLRTTNPSAPDPLPYPRGRLLASALVLLTFLALSHLTSLNFLSVPRYLAAPTLALFLLHALAQYAATLHLRTLIALADLDANHPGTPSSSRLHPSPTPHVKVGPLHLPISPRPDRLLRLSAPIADLYLRYPHLAWIP